MPKVTYAGSQTIEFETSDELIAVRTRGSRILSERTTDPAQMALMDDFELEVAFPEAGVEVFRRKKGKSKSAVRELKNELRRFPETRFAGSVLTQKGSNEPVVYTENLFIKFDDSCTTEHCAEILSEVGLIVKRPVEYARNAWFAEAPEGTGQQVFEIAQMLLEREDVECAHPELVRRRALRAINPNQWHLHQTIINGQTINAHSSADAAHRLTRGEGVTIAVIDDGCDIDHEEFSGSGKITAPRDVSYDVTHPQHADPRPGARDHHGTACSGVACGDGRFEASGVAPAARLMPIRLVEGLGSQAEADAFQWAADNGADVISCSWGPRDGRWWDPGDPLHNTFVALPDNTRLAIEYAVNNGRGGRGCVICWAAGNGNESVSNDGYASHPQVLAVAACNDRGRRSVYSDFGPEIFCAFPSSDQAWPAQGHPAPLTPGIWTTDRSGRPGYNSGSVLQGDPAGNYTNDFGGTSSSAPGVAGVAALVLSRNPELRWDEVRRVLQHSCDRIDTSGGNYNADGHSDWYGFGRLNAERAVRNALAGEPVEAVIVSGRFNAAVADFRRTIVSLHVAEQRTVERIRVDIDIQHTYIGDLVVRLVPPAASGAEPVILHDRQGGSTNQLRRRYDESSVADLSTFNGMTPAGDWKLEVEDRAHRDQGHIRFFGLELHPSGSTETRMTPLTADSEESEGDRSAGTNSRRSRRGRTRRGRRTADRS